MVILENFGIKDLIDVVLVAVLMYQLYRLVRRSGTSTIFNGIISFFIIWVLVSQVFEMRLLGSILDKFVNIGLFVVIIIFQDEIRRFLMTLGSHNTFRTIKNFFRNRKSAVSETTLSAIVGACVNMSKTKTGALIVIEQEISLVNFENTGEIVNATISTRLVENIFFKNSPLHDGAMIIADYKIKAAGCILPVAQNSDLPKFLGLRHRAAIGITQETDAKVIIVSEERGKISIANHGRIQVNVTVEELYDFLVGAYTKGNKKK